jgi:hypothetical protein
MGLSGQMHDTLTTGQTLIKLSNLSLTTFGEMISVIKSGLILFSANFFDGQSRFRSYKGNHTIRVQGSILARENQS